MPTLNKKKVGTDFVFFVLRIILNFEKPASFRNGNSKPPQAPAKAGRHPGIRAQAAKAGRHPGIRAQAAKAAGALIGRRAQAGEIRREADSKALSGRQGNRAAKAAGFLVLLLPEGESLTAPLAGKQGGESRRLPHHLSRRH